MSLQLSRCMLARINYEPSPHCAIINTEVCRALRWRRGDGCLGLHTGDWTACQARLQGYSFKCQGRVFDFVWQRRPVCQCESWRAEGSSSSHKQCTQTQQNVAMAWHSTMYDPILAIQQQLLPTNSHSSALPVANWACRDLLGNLLGNLLGELLGDLTGQGHCCQGMWGPARARTDQLGHGQGREGPSEPTGLPWGQLGRQQHMRAAAGFRQASGNSAGIA